MTGNDGDKEHHLHTRSYMDEVLHLLLCGGGILACYGYFGVMQEKM